jgi:2-polyprenyl-3-methyl-5-hydroxy-6-metoxy-1,4-benzoquinol methylase
MWVKFGEKDPYFAVATNPEFKKDLFDESKRERFFQSGRDYVEQIFKLLETHLNLANYRPESALDFGCGVGRLCIPLAARCANVTGIDISPGMIQELSKNAAVMKTENVKGLVADLSDPHGLPSGHSYDFINTDIVLQHSAPKNGMRMIENLLTLLKPRGIAVIHVTYARQLSWAHRLFCFLRKNVPGVHPFTNLCQKQAWNYPLMQMYEYNLHQVLTLFQARGIVRVYTEFTQHGYAKGGLFLVAKDPSYQASL